jgi:hypothetical protein
MIDTIYPEEEQRFKENGVFFSGRTEIEALAKRVRV